MAKVKDTDKGKLGFRRQATADVKPKDKIKDKAEEKVKARDGAKGEDTARRIMPPPRPLRWVVGLPAAANPTKNGRSDKSIG